MTGERGFALVTVVLLMIGLAVLATGLLFAASQQATVATTLVDLARARHGAEAAVAVALEEWRASARSLDPIGVSVAVVPEASFQRGVRISASAHRIARGSFLVTGRAVVSRGGLPPLQRSAVRLVHSLDADELGARLDAGLIGRRVSIGPTATITRGDSAAREPNGAALCARWPSQAAAVRAPADSLSIADVAALNGLAIFTDPEPLAVLEPLGTLAPALRTGARAIGADSVTPTPATLGLACDTALVTNWGAPDGPCGDLYVLRHATAGLTVDGGYGQGVLLVDGDVTLDGGVVFRGIIVAQGSVTVRNATVHGAIVAPGIAMQAGSLVTDRCAVADALALAPLLRAAHPPARSWLPTFE